jgi:hypothetical protein
VVELGAWERRSEDVANGRFRRRAELGPQISSMLDDGISLRAIADALNLAGIPGPPGHSRWQAADVRFAAEGRRQT